MKKIYIGLQLILGLYCAQLLYPWYRHNIKQLIGLLGVHFLLYLLSKGVKKQTYKQVFIFLDLFYLSIMLIGGCNYEMIMLIVLVGLESLILKIDMSKKLIILGVTLWISSLFIDLLMNDWPVYSILILVTVFIGIADQQNQVWTKE